MSMLRVRRVGRLVFAIATAAALSSYRVVAVVWSMPRSVNNDRRYIANLPASAAAINSASVELWDTVDWKRERYMAGAPAK